MMKNHPLHQILHPVHGMWRSLVAHLLWEQGVAGSNPAIPTIQAQERLVLRVTTRG